MTARQLLAALNATGFRLTVRDQGVFWDDQDDPPAELLKPLMVLHTGVRAILTGGRWFGIDPKTGRPCGPRPKDGSGLLAFGALDPGSKLPASVGLLCCESDTEWDRLHHSARFDLPYLFTTEPERGQSR